MIKRSFRVSVLVTGIVLSGVVAAPAFAQNFGLMPRGSCPKLSPAASYTPPARSQQQHPAPQRPKRRGFGSPF